MRAPDRGAGRGVDRRKPAAPRTSPAAYPGRRGRRRFPRPQGRPGRHRGKPRCTRQSDRTRSALRSRRRPCSGSRPSRGNRPRRPRRPESPRRRRASCDVHFTASWPTLSLLIVVSAGFECVFEISCPPDGQEASGAAAAPTEGSATARAATASAKGTSQRRSRFDKQRWNKDIEPPPLPRAIRARRTAL
jgi:hypothetical protein